MGYYYLIVNPTKREYIDPDVFGGGIKLSGPHTVLVLSRLIAEPRLGRGTIDGRWAGDPVILAGGMGGDPDNLYDRALETGFADISRLALAELCDDDEVRQELLLMAEVAGKPFVPGSPFVSEPFFLDLCNALIEYRPRLMLERDFTSRLGTDWRKRYEKVYRKYPRRTGRQSAGG